MCRDSPGAYENISSRYMRRLIEAPDNLASRVAVPAIWPIGSFTRAFFFLLFLSIVARVYAAQHGCSAKFEPDFGAFRATNSRVHLLSLCFCEAHSLYPLLTCYRRAIGPEIELTSRIDLAVRTSG